MLSLLRKHRGLSMLILACLVYLSSGPRSVLKAVATTYYVRTDGSDGNSGTANTAAGAWRHIDWGADHAAAGDTVRVQAGTYPEIITPAVNGTLVNPITVVADGVVTACGMTFSSKSYIRTVSLTLDPGTSGCSNSDVVIGTGTNTGLEFWNVSIDHDPNGKAYLFDMFQFNRCDKCIVIGGSLHNIGGGNGGVNSLVALTFNGDDFFGGYVDFRTICYVGIGPAGSRHRYVNMNFSDMLQCNGGGAHPDFFYVGSFTNVPPLRNMLWESMFGVGTPTSTDNKIFHAQNDNYPGGGQWLDNVVRFNVTYNMGSASAWSLYAISNGGDILRWRQYNNSHVLGARAAIGADFTSCSGNNTANGGVLTHYVFNSIFYQCWADTGDTSRIDPFGGNVSPAGSDYNLAFDPRGSVTFDPRWTVQAHKFSNVNPQFTNIGSLDFSLTSPSGARGTGGPLTTTVGAGVSSTSLTVATGTGSFFIGSNAANLPQYGGALVPGDFITVGSTSVQVSSVAGDVLTLATPISWSNGASVYYGTSSTIDIGAFPYKAGGYTLSAGYVSANGTTTITPNDALLVRFIVCYSDGVPYSVDNSSPYTCPYATGTFEARVYPRYASPTLYATALSNFSNVQGVLDQSRRINWGLAGAGSIPTRLTICTTLTSVATAAQVQTAIDNCPADQTVKLSAGHYNLNGQIRMKSNVTVRGDGPQTGGTWITSNNNGGCSNLQAPWCFGGGDGSDGQSPSNLATWSGGYTAGTRTITLAEAGRTGSVLPFVNGVMVLDQLADGTIYSQDAFPDVFVCSVGNQSFAGGSCTQNGSGSGNTSRGAGALSRPQFQVVRVTSVTLTSGACPCTVGIDPPLYLDWKSTRTPQAWWANLAPVLSAGLEDLRIQNSQGNIPAIGGFWAAKVWIKNVQIDQAATGRMFHFDITTGLTTRSMYLFNTTVNPGSETDNYGLNCWVCSSWLVENNIIQHVRTPLITEAANGVAYVNNFTLNHYDETGWRIGGFLPHGQHACCFLIEGNDAFNAEFENYFGSTILSTIFRNRLYGYDQFMPDSQTVPVLLYNLSRYTSLIANVLGTVGYHNHYEMKAGDSHDYLYCHTVIYAIGLGGNCSPSDNANKRVTVLAAFIGSPTATNGTLATTTDLGVGDTVTIHSPPTTDYSVTLTAVSGGGANITWTPNIGIAPVVGWSVYFVYPIDDTRTLSTMMRWGNWDTVTSTNPTGANDQTGVRWDATEVPSGLQRYANLVPRNHNLPASFVYPTRPSYWPVTISFPAIGPDVIGGDITNSGGHAYKNPAHKCADLMGAAFNDTTPKNFISSSCYPVP